MTDVGVGAVVVRAESKSLRIVGGIAGGERAVEAFVRTRGQKDMVDVSIPSLANARG